MLSVRLDAWLWLFVAARHRREEIEVVHDGTSSLGHVVTSLGVPLTEVGVLRVNGHAVSASHCPADCDVVDVAALRRPQPAPTDPPRFLLDVHLGALARRLRLLGLDVSYRNDASDDELLVQSLAEQRVLLTRDRGLLRRRNLQHGAYVRSDDPDEQVADVLDRFRPLLAPWTRCTACNGALAVVDKNEIEASLEPGTRRSYDDFAQCAACGRIYWRGAHHRRLAAWVQRFTSPSGFVS